MLVNIASYMAPKVVQPDDALTDSGRITLMTETLRFGHAAVWTFPSSWYMGLIQLPVRAQVVLRGGAGYYLGMGDAAPGVMTPHGRPICNYDVL